MRVLFVGVGTTPYVNHLLNRLQSDAKMEVVNVVAEKGPGHAEPGVFQTLEGIHYFLERLEEFQIPKGYRSFRGLARVLLKHRPEVVVTSEVYLSAFALHPPLRTALALAGSRLLLKSIPFRLASYQERLSHLPRGRTRPGVRALLEWDRFLYRWVDGHLNYIEDGVEVFGSYGVPKERIFLTRNSPDTDSLLAAAEAISGTPPPLPPVPHRLIHVGRLVEWKRVDLLIAATADLREEFPGLELAVVGTGPQESTLKKKAADLGLQDAVRFVGGVYHPVELGRMLKAADLYVLAGMGGLSINDAMCFGMPIVCSVGDGTEKFLVRPGENGLLFQEGDRSDLVRVLKTLLRDPALRQKMGQRSRQIITREVNIHTLVQAYTDAFNTVTSVKRRRP